MIKSVPVTSKCLHALGHLCNMAARSLVAIMSVILLSATYSQAQKDPKSLTYVNGTLFFSAITATNGLGLWKSDGSLAGTQLVKDIAPATVSSNTANFIKAGSLLYFTVNGNQLWRSDGTAQGTVLAKSLFSAVTAPVSQLTDVNGTLYFVLNKGGNVYELWKSNGTDAGTVALKTYTSVSGQAGIASLANANGVLYFAAYEAATGMELWKSNGTSAGTVLVKDINPGNNSSHPSAITFWNGNLYFAADDGSVAGKELWKSDGTAAGTILLKDIAPAQRTSGGSLFAASSRPSGYTAFKGLLYFSATSYEDQYGNRATSLWKTDGTPEGTVEAGRGADSIELTVVGESLFYGAGVALDHNGYTSVPVAKELWKSDGTTAGSVIVKDFNFQDPQRPAGEINPISELVNMNGTLYISFEGRRNAYETDIELWKSDGTTAGTVIVKDIHPGRGCSYSEPPGCFNGSYPRELTAVNNTLFFSAFDGKSSSRHLWKSDGTEAGTVKLFTPDPSACTASGTILREYWTSVTGTAISSIPVNTAPATSTQLTSFEAPTNVGDNYGQRIRGYICAPATGQYQFAIASDDNSELWLSTDDNPANKKKIASVTGWTNPREWNKYPSQFSATINLEEGKKYYIEALHKEAAGGDNLAVAWYRPGVYLEVISGLFLSPFVPSAPICTASGSILREYWANVTGSTVATVPVNATPSSTSQLSSFEAPTNVADNYAQRIRGYICAPATGNYTFYIASDNESELWLSTDDSPAKKLKIATVASGGSAWTNPREWGKYAGQKSASIVLEQGKKYYMEALHKENMNGDNLAVAWQTPTSSTITVIPGSVLSPFVPSAPICNASGTILREYWANVTGLAVSTIPLTTTPTSSSTLTSFEAPSNVADNYGQRIRGYICAPATGNYTFYIASNDDSELWLSTDDNVASKRKIASVTGWTNYREWTKFASQKSAVIYLEQGKKYYVEALHKEDKQSDNLTVAWQTPANSTITIIPGSVLSPFVPASTARLASGEEKQPLGLSVFPNPSSGEKLQVQVQGMDSKQAVKLSLYNSVGTLMFSQAYESDEAGTLAKELHLSGKVSSGIYLLKAESKGKTLVQRVVIHK